MLADKERMIQILESQAERFLPLATEVNKDKSKRNKTRQEKMSELSKLVEETLSLVPRQEKDRLSNRYDQLLSVIEIL